jgi:hypothetical protein
MYYNNTNSELANVAAMTDQEGSGCSERTLVIGTVTSVLSQSSAPLPGAPPFLSLPFLPPFSSFFLSKKTVLFEEKRLEEKMLRVAVCYQNHNSFIKSDMRYSKTVQQIRRQGGPEKK